MRKTKRAPRASKEEEAWLSTFQASFAADGAGQFSQEVDTVVKELRSAMNARNNVSGRFGLPFAAALLFDFLVCFDLQTAFRRKLLEIDLPAIHLRSLGNQRERFNKFMSSLFNSASRATTPPASALLYKLLFLRSHEQNLQVST